MMHIVDMSCISPQNTYHHNSLDGNSITHTGHLYLALEPEYKNFIARGALRRMGKALRLGIGAGHPIVNRHENINGIIISSGNGGLGECVQFLDQIIQYNEGTLTPTHFVNSTANSVAGNLALQSKCNAYNATHVGQGFGFEAALLDALMHFEEAPNQSILLGNVDEISEYNSNLEHHRGSFKTEETTSKTLLKSTSDGTVMGEGATMFLMTDKTQNKIASILDVGMVQTVDHQEILVALLDFLSKNNLSPDQIGTLILGFNGDGTGDKFYHYILEEKFKNQTVLSFKNLVGDYPTVSGFALWMACQKGEIPKEAIFRKGNLNKGLVLIYNHYLNEQHGFILVDTRT